MSQRNHVSIVMFFGCLALAGLLAWRGVTMSWDWCGYFNCVVTAAGLGYSAFDLWAWRWWGINRFVGMPDLNGTWRVILYSEWVNRETNERIDPIVAYMAIRQTHSTLSMRLMTLESESYLLTGKVLRAEDKLYSVAAVYQNTPKQSLSARSPIHYGAFLLRVRGETEVYALDGAYWTSRNTRGDMKLEERRSEIFHCFSKAEKAFGPGEQVLATTGKV